MLIVKRYNDDKYNECITNAHKGLFFNYDIFKEACKFILNIELEKNDKYNREKLKQAALKMYNLIYTQDLPKEDTILIKNNIEDGKITNKPVKKNSKNVNKK